MKNSKRQPFAIFREMTDVTAQASFPSLHYRYSHPTYVEQLCKILRNPKTWSAKYRSTQGLFTGHPANQASLCSVLNPDSGDWTSNDCGSPLHYVCLVPLNNSGTFCEGLTDPAAQKAGCNDGWDAVDGISGKCFRVCLYFSVNLAKLNHLGRIQRCEEHTLERFAKELYTTRRGPSLHRKRERKSTSQLYVKQHNAPTISSRRQPVQVAHSKTSQVWGIHR